MNNAGIIFQLTTGDKTIPIADAEITIYDSDGNYMGVTKTDESGKTPIFSVMAPSSAATFNPYSEDMPYGEYYARIDATGYIPVDVKGIQVYEGITSIEELELNPIGKGRDGVTEEYDIPEPALLQNVSLLPEAIPNPAVNPLLLETVYIPSRITVHLGTPSNASARNISVSFPDYIKNVASSEIYPTWPESALRANIYAQISFALNRIFTEWYTSRGYNFNITNSTAYDQAFVPGRNIFDNISRIVDEIFNEYVRRQGALNPLFTEYCNGSTVTCNGLSQWGTVSFAEQGYSPLAILQQYYGNNIELTATDNIQDIVSSYPGYALKKGMTDPAVKTVKTQLNRVRKNYPLIPEIRNMDNYFSEETEQAVKTFQSIFNLTSDGIVGKATWNKLSYLYVAVLKLAELNGGMITPSIPEESPSIILKLGSTGTYVKLAQYFLAVISQFYDILPLTAINGNFDTKMRDAVIDFQKNFNLDPDGIIGPKTWKALYDTFLGIGRTTGLSVDYPGTLLREGSRGDQVWLMQSYLQTLSRHMAVPYINADGIFGSKTKAAVIAFQRITGLAPDGIIGPDTWDSIVAARLLYQ